MSQGYSSGVGKPDRPTSPSGARGRAQGLSGPQYSGSTPQSFDSSFASSRVGLSSGHDSSNVLTSAYQIQPAGYISSSRQLLPRGVTAAALGYGQPTTSYPVPPASQTGSMMGRGPGSTPAYPSAPSGGSLPAPAAPAVPPSDKPARANRSTSRSRDVEASLQPQAQGRDVRPSGAQDVHGLGSQRASMMQSALQASSQGNGHGNVTVSEAMQALRRLSLGTGTSSSNIDAQGYGRQAQGQGRSLSPSSAQAIPLPMPAGAPLGRLYASSASQGLASSAGSSSLVYASLPPAVRGRQQQVPNTPSTDAYAVSSLGAGFDGDTAYSTVAAMTRGLGIRTGATSLAEGHGALDSSGVLSPAQMAANERARARNSAVLPPPLSAHAPLTPVFSVDLLPGPGSEGGSTAALDMRLQEEEEALEEARRAADRAAEEANERARAPAPAPEQVRRPSVTMSASIPVSLTTDERVMHAHATHRLQSQVTILTQQLASAQRGMEEARKEAHAASQQAAVLAAQKAELAGSIVDAETKLAAVPLTTQAYVRQLAELTAQCDTQRGQLTAVEQSREVAAQAARLAEAAAAAARQEASAASEQASLARARADRLEVDISEITRAEIASRKEAREARQAEDNALASIARMKAEAESLRKALATATSDYSESSQELQAARQDSADALVTLRAAMAGVNMACPDALGNASWAISAALGRLSAEKSSMAETIRDLQSDARAATSVIHQLKEDLQGAQAGRDAARDEASTVRVAAAAERQAALAATAVAQVAREEAAAARSIADASIQDAASSKLRANEAIAELRLTLASLDEVIAGESSARAELFALKSERDELEAEVASLHTRLESALQQIVDTGNELGRNRGVAESTVHRLEEALARAKEEGALALAAAQDASRREAASARSASDSALEAMRKRAEATEEELRSSRARADSLQDQLVRIASDASSRLDAVRAEHATIRKDLETALASAQQEVTREVSERTPRNAEIARLQAELLDTKDTLSEMGSVVDAGRVRRAEAEARAKAAEDKVASSGPYLQEMESMRRRAKEVEDAAAESTSALSAAREELSVLKRRVEASSTELLSLRSVLADRSAEGTALRSSLTDAVEEAASLRVSLTDKAREAACLTDERSMLKSKLGEASRTLENVTERLARLQVAAAEAQADAAAQRSRAEVADGAAVVAAQAMLEAQARVASLQVSADTAFGDAEAARRETAVFAASLAESRAAASRYAQAAEGYRIQLDAARTQAAISTSDASAVSSAASSAALQRDSAMAAAHEARLDAAHAEACRAEAEAALVSVERAMVASQMGAAGDTAAVKAYVSQVQASSAQLSGANAHLQALVQALQLAQTELQGRVHAAREDARAALDETAALRLAMQRKDAEHVAATTAAGQAQAQLKSQLGAAQGRVVELLAQLAAAHARADAALAKADAVGASRNSALPRSSDGQGRAAHEAADLAAAKAECTAMGRQVEALQIALDCESKAREAAVQNSLRASMEAQAAAASLDSSDAASASASAVVRAAALERALALANKRAAESDAEAARARAQLSTVTSTRSPSLEERAAAFLASSSSMASNERMVMSSFGSESVVHANHGGQEGGQDVWGIASSAAPVSVHNPVNDDADQAMSMDSFMISATDAVLRASTAAGAAGSSTDAALAETESVVAHLRSVYGRSVVSSGIVLPAQSELLELLGAPALPSPTHRQQVEGGRVVRASGRTTGQGAASTPSHSTSSPLPQSPGNGGQSGSPVLSLAELAGLGSPSPSASPTASVVDRLEALGPTSSQGVVDRILRMGAEGDLSNDEVARLISAALGMTSPPPPASAPSRTLFSSSVATNSRLGVAGMGPGLSSPPSPLPSRGSGMDAISPTSSLGRVRGRPMMGFRPASSQVGGVPAAMFVPGALSSSSLGSRAVGGALSAISTPPKIVAVPAGHSKGLLSPDSPGVGPVRVALTRPSTRPALGDDVTSALTIR